MTESNNKQSLNNTEDVDFTRRSLLPRLFFWIIVIPVFLFVLTTGIYWGNPFQIASLVPIVLELCIWASVLLVWSLPFGYLLHRMHVFPAIMISLCGFIFSIIIFALPVILTISSTKYSLNQLLVGIVSLGIIFPRQEDIAYYIPIAQIFFVIAVLSWRAFFQGLLDPKK